MKRQAAADPGRANEMYAKADAMYKDHHESGILLTRRPLASQIIGGDEKGQRPGGVTLAKLSRGKRGARGYDSTTTDSVPLNYILGEHTYYPLAFSSIPVRGWYCVYKVIVVMFVVAILGPCAITGCRNVISCGACSISRLWPWPWLGVYLSLLSYY